MLKHANFNKLQLASVAALSLLLTACDDDDDNASTSTTTPEQVNASYDITVTNLTNAQPLSPAAVILHQEGNLWTVGEAASSELEQMAEGGDNSALRGLGVVRAEASGAAPIGPGGSETISVSIEDSTDVKLSVATMLVNTNDAFSGLDAWDLGQLATGDSWMTVSGVYDAGTEANTEAAGTIPGPADGSDGAGFNADRNDVNFVAGHPGIVSSDDGLSNSVLTSQHKFDNPAIRIKVTRTE
jgi:hypothetical protein